MSNQQDFSWKVVVQPSLAAAAHAVAREAAARLRDDAVLQTALRLASEQSPSPDVIRWQPVTVAGGNAGLALMCGHLDVCFPAEGWDLVGHRHLLIAAGAAQEETHLSPGLFSGWSGLAFTTWFLGRGGTRYRKLLAALDQKLLPRLNSFAQFLSAQREGVAVGHYDVVSGLAGIGAYLLCRREDPRVTSVIEAVLRALVNLTGEEAGLPYWHTPWHLLPDEDWKATCPDGYMNCGLAHGIPGPLALLALALSCGCKVPGIEAAIERSANWLLGHRVDDEWGVNWPVVVPVGSSIAGSLQPSRTAWCYGIPGIARALWLAGEVLDSSTYRDMAVAALKGVYRRPLSVRSIDSPTFCHGIAGLLQVTLRFAHDTGEPLFGEEANALLAQLLSLYDPDTLLGYRDQYAAGHLMDQAALLNGVAGIILALLAASTTAVPTWDRFFLLS